MHKPGSHVVFIDHGSYVFYRFGNGQVTTIHEDGSRETRPRGQYTGSDPCLGRPSREVLAECWARLRAAYPTLETYETIACDCH
jgi:hypothetical protein